MLTSDLYAIFSQLLSGTLALLTILVLWWLIREPPQSTVLRYMREWFRKCAERLAVKANSTELLVFAVAIGACGVFGLGLALQTAVDDFVDDSPFSSTFLTWPVSVLVGDETAYRFSALTKRDDQLSRRELWDKIINKGLDRSVRREAAFKWGLQAAPFLFRRYQLIGRCQPDVPYRLTGLGQELITDDPGSAIAAVGPGSVGERGFQLYTQSPVLRWTTGQCKEAERFARKLYYDAVNFAVGRDAEGKLLARWSSQIDFMGCAAYASILILLTTSVFVFWHEVPRRFSRRAKENRSAKLRSAWKVLALSIFGVYASCTVYLLAEVGYVERVFGFYSSQISLKAVFPQESADAGSS